jgi:transposase
LLVPELPRPAPGCASCAARDAEIAALRAQLAELGERVARMERAASRNSGNSSMPPSSDDLPGRRPPRSQRRAAERADKRRRGKQPGAPGSAMCWAEPDETRDYYPRGTCACGAGLGSALDLGVARSYQQMEIPEPSARRIQHDLHLGLCGCGREHLAARPAGVPDAPVSIGPNLRALAVYLVVFQHVPVERCRDLIADVTGAAVSTGFIHSCLRAAAGLAAG